jgi:1-acyl-sn-glycerol-3-phosphate acyltransferase
MVRHAVADLKAGGQLVLFPEGTRTTHRPINPFRPGFTVIAKMARAPIQTVIIDTRSPYLGKGWPLWRLPPLPIEFSVRLGRRFEPADDPAAQLREIEAYIAHELGGPSPASPSP